MTLSCCLGRPSGPSGKEFVNEANEGLGLAGADGDGRLGIVKTQRSALRNHFIITVLSMCITVDILQYSMPLSFLPSVLEDRGHSTMKIASAIGVYYWTGFAGAVVITAYQLGRVLSNCQGKSGASMVTAATVRKHIKFLTIGLFIGTLTLGCQAVYPHYLVHITCRFVQGAAGALIFFYAFLLSVNMFEANSQEQDDAMTAASIALNVAEVLGSLLGALVFDRWGQRSVFWVLGATSVLNQVGLIVVYHLVEASDEPSPAQKVEWVRAQLEQSLPPSPVAGRSPCQRLCRLVKSRRLITAVVLIFLSAVVKGAVEEILPFHADHQWGLDPLSIGYLFAASALAYIVAALSVRRIWRVIPGPNFRVLFGAGSLVALGLSAPLLFTVVIYTKQEVVLFAVLIAYGAFLGFAYTPSTLLVADAIDHEEGPARDAVNGIWNTMWEAGGSLGFLLGGSLAEHHGGQIRLMVGCSISCILGAGFVLALYSTPLESFFVGGGAHLSAHRPSYSSRATPRV